MTTKEQNAFIESMNLGKQQNVFFIAGLGNSFSLLVGLIGLVVVTCLCAYLLIYNILHLSVSGKVRYYGLLQTIGTTQKADKIKCYKKQMLIIVFIGIIVGCLLGVFVSFSLIPIVVKSLGIKKELCGFYYGLFSPDCFTRHHFASWIYDLSASRKPVKMATAVSPIEALGYRSASKSEKNQTSRKV